MFAMKWPNLLINVVRPLGALLFCVLLNGFSWAQTNVTKTTVGDVTLVIGAAQVQRGDQHIALSKGAVIMEGDLILTQANGHLHLRFIDGALVSVRPSSSLKVVEYQFDKANPSASVVRFMLNEGVVRAISGQAAESAKEKFRLNTPLAAIGVKGTDFLVESGPKRVSAVVNQGAIVFAPIGGICKLDGLGPCASSSARELTAAMRGMALTYTPIMSGPQMLPVLQLRGSDLSNVPSAPPIDTPTTHPVKGQQSNLDGKLESKSAANVGQVLRSVATNEGSLVWGRWGAIAQQDTLTVAFREAMQSRAVTIGDGYYFLFRREAGISNLMSVDQGLVNFSLQSSHTNFIDPSTNELRPASVKGGTLGINFSTNDFKTSLQLGSPVAADQSLSSSGKLNPTTGIFLSTEAQPKVAGALSLDTRQAGYLFSTPAQNGGAFRGATTWGR